ncbi:hypothetical protein VWH97_07480 [Escherichia coli O157]|nr:hypothetical protein [Escherichia coli O157]
MKYKNLQKMKYYAVLHGEEGDDWAFYNYDKLVEGYAYNFDDDYYQLRIQYDEYIIFSDNFCTNSTSIGIGSIKNELTNQIVKCRNKSNEVIVYTEGANYSSGMKLIGRPNFDSTDELFQISTVCNIDWDKVKEAFRILDELNEIINFKYYLTKPSESLELTNLPK